MKLRLTLILLMGSILFTSCGDDCMAEGLDEVIVGTWSVTALGTNGGEIEFLADGTLLDPNDIFISGEINGTVLDEKTYEVVSDATIRARAESGGQFLDFDFDVIRYDCDQIVINVLGFNVELDRQ